MFLEKYIARARHVEVQIFGNRFGEVVTLGERDCSIQRRNQKVIEESPAPNLPDEVREAMFAASASGLHPKSDIAVREQLNFCTILKPAEFYFLEVNTRLQVEHGVTEEVLGIDLVEWMVREAADELAELNLLVKQPWATVFKPGYMRRIVCRISVQVQASWIKLYSRIKRESKHGLETA